MCSCVGGLRKIERQSCSAPDCDSHRDSLTVLARVISLVDAMFTPKATTKTMDDSLSLGL